MTPRPNAQQQEREDDRPGRIRAVDSHSGQRPQLTPSQSRQGNAGRGDGVSSRGGVHVAGPVNTGKIVGNEEDTEQGDEGQQDEPETSIAALRKIRDIVTDALAECDEEAA